MGSKGINGCVLMFVMHENKRFLTVICFDGSLSEDLGFTVLLTFILFSLSACSEITKGDKLSDSATSDPATPISSPTPNPPALPTFSISGQISVAPLVLLDSDINDPNAAVDSDNGAFNRAQSIANFSIINGFATQVATGRNTEGDRFSSIADPDDVYQLNLQKGQPIRLQVIDYAGTGTFKGDLDLYLYDSNGNQIDASFSVADEFEQVTVPADGFYYIAVNAYSGSSKYVLTLDNISTANTPSLSNFLVNQAIVKYKNTPQQKSSVVNSVSIQTIHTDNRATLATFNYAAKSNTPASSFEESLKKLNPSSYAKYRTLQTIKSLKLQKNVEYAEPNYIRQALATPNDTLYPLQWHYPAINLPAAWDITDGSRAQDVIVAVIDTGVFLAHDDLVNKLVSGFDFISDPTNARDNDGIDNNPDDPGDSSLQGQSSWHGTHVAGTIAAETNNNKGVAGISWKAKIMPLRALGTLGGSSYDIVQAVLYAAGLPNDSNAVPPQIADIINLSLGGDGSSTFEQNAYTSARNAGVIIIAAAGNENSSTPSFPASYNGVISVSATGLDNTLAPYSNFGSNIDIAAPGGNQAVDLDNDGNADGVFSSLVDDSTGTRKASYKGYQGTSMATPHIAGVVALMRAVNPSLSPDELDVLITSGKITTDLGTTGRDDSFGYGLIDALKAVQEAQLLNNGGVLPPQPAIISASPQQLSLGSNTTQASVTISNIGGDIAQITSVTDDATWLTVTENVVDANKLGSYALAVNKIGLADNASYLATITFNISTGATLTLPVSMIKGAISTVGDVGRLYLLLINSDGSVKEQTLPTNVGNGFYSYQFNAIESADYTLLVGSDIDNDLLICQTGESCGAYPTLNRINTITLDSDKTNIDFTVDIQSTFSAASLSLNATPSLNLGSARLAVPAQ